MSYYSQQQPPVGVPPSQGETRSFLCVFHVCSILFVQDPFGCLEKWIGKACILLSSSNFLLHFLFLIFSVIRWRSD